MQYKSESKLLLEVLGNYNQQQMALLAESLTNCSQGKTKAIHQEIIQLTQLSSIIIT